MKATSDPAIVVLTDEQRAIDNGVYRLYPCAECARVGPGFGCNAIRVHPVVPVLVVAAMASWCWIR